MLRIDDGTGFPTYRFLKNLQVGDATTNSAATSLIDTNCTLVFDNTRRLLTRATQPTSWTIEFGTKVGSGSEATGKDGVDIYYHPSTTLASVLRGTVKLYGCTFKKKYVASNQQLQFPNMTTGASELINCMFDGFSSYVLGSSGSPIDVMYNVDITGALNGNMITSFFVNTADRITMGNPNLTGASNYLASAAAGLSFKDIRFFGGTGVGALQASPGASNWIMVRPVWPDGMTLFDISQPDNDPDNGMHEYWLWNVKVVGADGVGVAGVPVKLTDSLGNLQVDEITDSEGRISFGSGLTANAVIVRDHYTIVTTYTTRERSPFLVEINTGGSAVIGYPSRRYYMDWPGITSGRFSDVNDVISLADPSGASTNWTECTL